MNKQTYAKITGIGIHLPEKILTNRDLEKIIDTSDEWIKTRTGIEERRIAGDGVFCTDLGAEAAKNALAMAGLSSAEVELIIVATITPDMIWPANACLIQAKISADNAVGFDVAAGCTGFIYALTVASQFIETGTYKNALVIGTEVLSKIVNWDDRNTCVLFGDGAGAVVLQPSSGPSGIHANYLGSDGKGANLLNQPAGGTKIPASAQSIENNLHTIHMNGNEVFKFAVRVIEEAAVKVLEMADYKKEDIDLFIPHQANMRIVDAAVKRLQFPPEKVLVNLNKYGNMSAASIPVALYQALEEGRLVSGNKVLLVGFGAGLTWGATVLEW